MNCSVAGGETSTRKRTCLFDIDTHSYQLIGDSLECGRELLLTIVFLVIIIMLRTRGFAKFQQIKKLKKSWIGLTSRQFTQLFV